MTKSILSNERKCLICGAEYPLHKHHVFAGSNRRISERYGCWIYLCAYHHNASDYGIHRNYELDQRMKKQCQMAWEERFGDREEFIREFGRSYL